MVRPDSPKRPNALAPAISWRRRSGRAPVLGVQVSSACGGGLRCGERRMAECSAHQLIELGRTESVHQSLNLCPTRTLRLSAAHRGASSARCAFRCRCRRGATGACSRAHRNSARNAAVAWSQTASVAGAVIYFPSHALLRSIGPRADDRARTPRAAAVRLGFPRSLRLKKCRARRVEAYCDHEVGDRFGHRWRASPGELLLACR